jgi:hypothetical protein
MDDLATLWKKTDKRALRMTWKGWSLYDDAKEKEGVANALNDALIGAALVLWKRLREKGMLKGEELANAIDDALSAKWNGTANRYRMAGANDTEVMERAGKALRKFLRANPITEGVSMRGLLRNLEEANDRERILAGLMDRMASKEPDADQLPTLRLFPEEQRVVAKLPKFDQMDLWPSARAEALPNRRSIAGFLRKFSPDAGKIPTWFVLRLDRHTVLVDTEGYDYCRYAGRLMER